MLILLLAVPLLHRVYFLCFFYYLLHLYLYRVYTTFAPILHKVSILLLILHLLYKVSILLLAVALIIINIYFTSLLVSFVARVNIRLIPLTCSLIPWWWVRKYILLVAPLLYKVSILLLISHLLYKTGGDLIPGATTPGTIPGLTTMNLVPGSLTTK